MKLKIDPKLLSKALGVGLDSPRSPLEIYRHCLLRAEAGRLDITTSDGGAEMTQYVEADVLTPGEATCLGAELKRLVANMDKQITIASESEHVFFVTHGKGRFKMYGRSPREFPDILLEGEQEQFTVAADTLLSAIRDVSYAASTNDVMRAFNGVTLRGAHVSSSDNKRLASVMIEGINFKEAIIPIENIRAVESALNQDNARVTRWPRSLVIEGESCRYITQLLDYQAIDMVRVIPKDKPVNEAVLTAGDMVVALKRVMATISDGLGIRVTFKRTEGGFSLSDREQRCDDFVPAELHGEWGEAISLNPELMLQTMQQLPGKLRWQSYGPARAQVFLRGDDDSAVHILQPVLA